MMELYERLKSSEEIYKGRVFTVKKDVVELPGGEEATREVVLHKGGVGVIAITDDGKIPMVRQYRKGIEMVSLEIPAGKLEMGENPKDCGKRELLEETGYKAKEFNLLSRFSVTPAYCSEIIYVYIAKGLIKAEQNLDEDEYLNVEFYTLDELYKMVLDGEIIDSKTIIAIMMLYKK